MSHNDNALPETTLQKIKHTLLKILEIPVEAAHYIDVDVRKFGSEVKIVLVKDAAIIKQDFQKFEDIFRSKDNFESDAVNEGSDGKIKEYVFSAPNSVKQQLIELSNINNHEALLNKQDVVERLASEINDKFFADAIL